MFSADAYHWFKALHLIAVMSWMAGMLYLPRLYVYHAEVSVGSEASEMLKVMERRLLRYIINPAMIVAFVLGGVLMTYHDFKTSGWLHGKLFLLLLLTAHHGMLARWRKQFERDENRHTAKFYRVMNEVPTVLMIGIVLIVVLKPF